MRIIQSNSQKYVHSEEVHDMESPSILVPILIEMFNPKHICDVGCGIGNFLSVFKSLGAESVLGYDGEWTNKELIAKHLSKDEFKLIDFESVLPHPSQIFDIALCLEVAEHVSHEKSQALIDFLTELSHTVIFSAAIPYQGGQNHINEQWEEYWEEKFNTRGYKKYDIIRHKIYTNKRIMWWYRQNLVVYSKKDLSLFSVVNLSNIVVPELFVIKVNLISQLLSKLNYIC